VTLVLEGPFDTQEKIDAAFEAIEEHGLDDNVSEAESELRGSYTHETGIECEWSRHYESKSVSEAVLCEDSGLIHTRSWQWVCPSWNDA